LTSTGKWQVLLKIKWDKIRPGQSANPGDPLIDDPLRGSIGSEIWDYFMVGSEKNNFKLTVGTKVKRSNVPAVEDGRQSFHDYNDAVEFSTTDHGPSQDCATEASGDLSDGGGWWYNKCTWICLTADPASSGAEFWWQDGPKHIPSETVMAIRLMK
jgi:hypothetical protein